MNISQNITSSNPGSDDSTTVSASDIECSSQDYDTMDREHLVEIETDDEDNEDILGVAQMSSDFKELLSAISNRVNELSQQAKFSALSTHMQLRQTQIRSADVQIKELRKVMDMCDDLETELLKLQHLAEIASDYRSRIANIDSALNQLTK